eukprot:tig00000430_g631.t1
MACVRAGVCRHRALLFKYVADRIGLPCRLVRGHMNAERDLASGAHVWNVVLIAGKHYLCDVMIYPGELYEEGSEKAQLYVRIERVGARGHVAAGGIGGSSVAPVARIADIRLGAGGPSPAPPAPAPARRTPRAPA